MQHSDNRTIAGGPGERSKSIFYIKITIAVFAIAGLLFFAWNAVNGTDSEGRSKQTQNFLNQYDTPPVEPTAEELDRGNVFAQASDIANKGEPAFCVETLDMLENKTVTELGLLYSCKTAAQIDIGSTADEYVNALTAEGDIFSLFTAAEILETSDAVRAKSLYEQVITGAPDDQDEETLYLIEASQQKVDSL